MEVVHKTRMICNAIFSIHVSDKKLLAPFIMIVNFIKMLVLEISGGFYCFMNSSYVLIEYW